MSRDYARVQKGQVFWLDIEKAYGTNLEKYRNFKGATYNSAIPRGEMLWVVVSCNSGNENARTCNIVPILQSDEKNHLPVHVIFKFEGKFQIIKPEFITTVDIMTLQEYCYTLTDDTMDKLDRAIAEQLGIRPLITCNDFTMQNTLSKLEQVVSMVIESRIQEYKESNGSISESAIEDTALRLGEMIEDLFPEESMKAHLADPAKPQADYKKVTVVKKATLRNRWTPQLRLEFVSDMQVLSTREMLDKYHLKNAASLQETRRTISKWLNDHDVADM